MVLMLVVVGYLAAQLAFRLDLVILWRLLQADHYRRRWRSQFLTQGVYASMVVELHRG